MSLNTTEVIGFCDRVNQLMQDNKVFLKGEGVDVENWIPEITTLKNDAVTKDAEKDAARAVSKVKTKEAGNARDAAYKKASARLDVIISALGKGTPASKEAARLRSSLISQPRRSTGTPNNS